MLAIEFDDGGEGPVYVGRNGRGRAIYYESHINDAALFEDSAELLAFVHTEIKDGFQFNDRAHRIVEVDLSPMVTRTL